MNSVRPLLDKDIDAVVARVAARLAEDAQRQPLVNPVLDGRLLANALEESRTTTWVAERDGRIVGHLYGALLENGAYGRGAWVGPDGTSFDDVDVLSDLYAEVGATWIDKGALEHYVWTLDHPVSTQPWFEMGFAAMHRRGVLRLEQPRGRSLPEGYELRSGGIADLDLALELDGEMDIAQRQGPSFSINLDGHSSRDDLVETLEDPEMLHYLVEHAWRGVAQCITFPLPTRRGSFENTLHLSAVSVRPEHRGIGVAAAMVDRALSDGLDEGMNYVETNWRVTNRRAQRYWLAYGFVTTYVRLHRTIGAG